MPFEVSVDALFSKMCNHIEKRNGQKAVLSDIIIQGAIVRAIWCEKIRVGDVRCADIYFVFEFLNREWQFNWSIMESGDDARVQMAWFLHRPRRMLCLIMTWEL